MVSNYVRIDGKATVGKDTDGDGKPDTGLEYKVGESNTGIQFPKGFCPAAKNGVDDKCKGSYGIVVKEWETITKVYSPSATFLNKVTKQVDVDVLDKDGKKIEVKDLPKPINIQIERMSKKDPAAVKIPSIKDKSINDKFLFYI